MALISPPSPRHSPHITSFTQTWPPYHLLHKREKPHKKKGEKDAATATVVMKMRMRMVIVVIMVMIRTILIGANHQVLRMCQAPTHSLSTHYPLES